MCLPETNVDTCRWLLRLPSKSYRYVATYALGGTRLPAHRRVVLRQLNPTRKPHGKPCPTASSCSTSWCPLLRQLGDPPGRHAGQRHAEGCPLLRPGRARLHPPAVQAGRCPRRGVRPLAARHPRRHPAAAGPAGRGHDAAGAGRLRRRDRGLLRQAPRSVRLRDPERRAGQLQPQQLRIWSAWIPRKADPDGFRRALDVLGVGCPSGMSLDVQPHPELAERLRQLQQLARLAPERFGPAAPAAAPATLFHSLIAGGRAASPAPPSSSHGPPRHTPARAAFMAASCPRPARPARPARLPQGSRLKAPCLHIPQCRI